MRRIAPGVGPGVDECGVDMLLGNRRVCLGQIGGRIAVGEHFGDHMNGYPGVPKTGCTAPNVVVDNHHFSGFFQARQASFYIIFYCPQVNRNRILPDSLRFGGIECSADQPPPPFKSENPGCLPGQFEARKRRYLNRTPAFTLLHDTLQQAGVDNPAHRF